MGAVGELSALDRLKLDAGLASSVGCEVLSVLSVSIQSVARESRVEKDTEGVVKRVVRSIF